MVHSVRHEHAIGSLLRTTNYEPHLAVINICEVKISQYEKINLLLLKMSKILESYSKGK